MKSTFYSLLILSLLIISCTVATSTHTTKLSFNGGELLYTDSITEAQANALGNYLVENGFYDGKMKTVQLDKQNGVIHFAMVLNDSLANSPEYQTMGTAFIDELQQNVFKGSIVEVDYCDEYMKIRRNIKAVPDAQKAISVSDNNAATSITGTWYCSNIAGAENPDKEKMAAELEILKTNFTFTFNADNTFKSDFVNQSDVRKPIDLQGDYKIVNDKISLSNLTINGAKAQQEMLFDIALEEGQLYLSSKGADKSDLVMSFARTTIN